MEMWTWEFKDPGASPDVSIVICAYGKSHVTLACLEALVETQHYNSTRAEIILVDDCSPDDTVERVRGIRGLRLLAREENGGFLRAANSGVAIARGKNVLFLNNDTVPVGRWLDPLLELFDRRPKALVVGSRLVFPDGVLQEAGGIIFNDGSGWNYGRRMDAFDPRVTFERQVDYVSGASLLVRGDFLRSRGGFDERYVPAYYEDTDLCFAAREAGGEVWYQPASIIVHDEGQSHGTDTAVGIKAYQVVNREKFQMRWASALEKQHQADARVVPVARQRSQLGRILVIDNDVPTPDKDAGSVRLTAIMSAMLDMGYAVTFLPLNGWRREPYTRRLEQLGVEVLGAPDGWWACLEEESSWISHVWICRPHVAEQVLDRVRMSLPQARIAYDTIDLHFLRMEREAATTGSTEVLQAALDQKVQELGVMERSDAVIVVSPHEVEVLRDQVSKPVAIVPIIQVDSGATAVPSRRSGILFVGGFLHGPNADAVEWFATEVLPIVHRTHPEASFTIVGSHVPPRVEALASDRVRVMGWVEDLAPLYRQTRLAVAPLRFGAGVKGKVGESFALGVPMCMTPIAAEGMYVQHGVHALVAIDSEGFANEVVRLLEDDELWTQLSQAGRQLIHDNFGVEATRDLIAQALSAANSPKAMSWSQPSSACTAPERVRSHASSTASDWMSVAQ